jgi:DNA-binding transcriptional MerR regulator
MEINLVSRRDLVKKYVGELDLSKSMLSYYEKIGLVIPTKKDGNKKMYDEVKTIETIRQIRKWQESALGLEEIKSRLYGQSTPEIQPQGESVPASN